MGRDYVNVFLTVAFILAMLAWVVYAWAQELEHRVPDPEDFTCRPGETYTIAECE